MYAVGKVIPEKDSIGLGIIKDKQIPVYIQRYALSRNMGPEYSDWHTSHDENESKPAWGAWVHTFNSLCRVF